MRLLHVLNELMPSGAEVMLKVAAPCLKRAGYEIHVLSTGTAVGQYAEVLVHAGYQIHHIPFRRTPAYLWELFGFLRETKFDIVHIHAERAFFWHCMLARVAGCRRIVRSVHDVFLFSGYLRIKRKFQRFLARRFFGTIFASDGDSVQKIERELFDNPTVVLKNWVDQSYFCPASEAQKLDAKKEFGISPEEVVLLSVGTCNEKKSHCAVIEAMSKISKASVIPVRYLHRGTGPTRQDEESHAKRLGLDGLTTFVEYLDDIRTAYWASDIFVMTSPYEGLGNVILEAMSSGLPVVLYNVLGMRDTIVDGKGGFLVNCTSDDLADAVLRLVSDADLRRRLAMEAHASVMRNFSMNDSLSSLLRLYHEGVRGLAA